MKKIALLSPIALVLALSACAPERYESTPVVLETAQGPVTCQLYTKEIVSWDRSIDRPAAMSVKAADALCLEEGNKRR